MSLSNKTAIVVWLYMICLFVVGVLFVPYRCEGNWGAEYLYAPLWSLYGRLSDGTLASLELQNSRLIFTLVLLTLFFIAIIALVRLQHKNKQTTPPQPARLVTKEMDDFYMGKSKDTTPID
jgi:preprotein translocase subunit SecG